MNTSGNGEDSSVRAFPLEAIASSRFTDRLARDPGRPFKPYPNRTAGDTEQGLLGFHSRYPFTPTPLRPLSLHRRAIDLSSINRQSGNQD